MKKNASNVSTLKSDNRALILDALRKQPLSRTQLSNQTGLTKSAITLITNDLINEGQLLETESLPSEKGRRPVLLDIAKDNRFALGVALHRKKVTLCITNLISEVIDRIDANTADFADSAAAVDWICSSLAKLLTDNHIPLDKIIGIGVSSPGPVDYRSGIILNPPNFEAFHNLPIAALIRERFNLPVYLENNSVLLAITEYYRGAMKDYRNSLFVIIANGIGSCTILDGHIYRGFAGFAGELGHTSIDSHGLNCSCGNRGCVELYASLSALKERFNFDSFEQVVDDAYAHQTYAQRILDDAAENLSCALINAINLLDLDSIFLYGELNYRPELLIAKLNNLVERKSMIVKVHRVIVYPASLGADADAISSTAAVLNRHFGQQL